MMGFGNAAWEQDDFAAAFQHFRATLQDHPNFADIRNRAGLCLAMMGDPEGALEQFDKALEVNDCYAEALMNRAIVLNDLNRYDEAAECFHRASALDLRDSRAFPSHMGNQLANAHAKTGDLYMAADRPEEAATEYTAAVEVRPGFLDLRFKLAEAYRPTTCWAKPWVTWRRSSWRIRTSPVPACAWEHSSTGWETRSERGRNGSSVPNRIPTIAEFEPTSHPWIRKNRGVLRPIVFPR